MIVCTEIRMISDRVCVYISHCLLSEYTDVISPMESPVIYHIIRDFY